MYRFCCSTENYRLVECFLKKFRFFIARFLKSVITSSRRVNFLPVKFSGKERMVYGEFQGVNRRVAGDQHCGEEPGGEADAD